MYSLAHYSDSLAQRSSQKSPEITFHYSGDTITKTLTNGKSDKPLDDPDCCSELEATLTPIPFCAAETHGKVATPQDDPPPCCCGQLSVWETCGGQICQATVTFDPDVIDPLCHVCVPDGWSWAEGGDGIITFRYDGSTSCSGAIGPTPVNFVICGFTTPGPINYQVCGYFCKNTITGGCETDLTSFCCQRFTSTITCPTSGIASIPDSKPFLVDDGYPNPATSSIRFDYSARLDGSISLTLVDILGKTVSSSNNRVSQGDGNVTIDLSGAQPGGYYCVFEFNGEHITKRIQVK